MATTALLLASAITACGDPEPVVPDIATVAPAPPATAAQPATVQHTQAPVAAEVAPTSLRPMPVDTATPAPVVMLTPAVPSTPTPVPIQEVNFAGVITTTNAPSQIQVVFSLRDQDGHAIVLPAEQVERAIQVDERGPGTNDSWEEIDYTETSFFVHTAENIDLEVVFVLDFTNSMAAARLSDGNSGVDAMLRAFEAALAVLPSAHRIGVVEFHDRNVRPSVLSRLTTDRQAIQEGVNDFLASGFDSGSSRVWDSVVTGSDLFSSRQQNPRAVRALVFLSDGRDTSSDSTREQAARYAQERGVQLYALGVGNVFQEPELRSVAHSTDGAYYSAHDLNLVQEQLQLLVHDLRGQYQLTYITLRRSGEYRTAITAKLSGVQGSTEVGPFDVARFYGADNQGVVTLDTPSLDRAGQRATVFMRAHHIPRNIDRIRFRVRTDKPLDVEIAPRRDGGLLEGWSLSGPDADGWYEMASPTPLDFGSLGLLTKLTFSNVTEEGLEIPVEFDNSIYAGGKTLARSSYVGIGNVVRTERIAFESSRDGNWEIYVMNADGSDVTRLTDHPAYDGKPSISSDGRRIVFQSSRDGNWEIYVMNADGSDVTRLTDHPSFDGDPSWSPDGRRIVFRSNRDDNPDIYVMNADGSDVTRLTDHPSFDGDPGWSPDGRRIAFRSYRDGNPDIYVMNADGSDVTRLTDHPSFDGDPGWSPDGRHIAFRSYRDGNWQIYVMNADGSDVTRLTNDEEGNSNPIWSSDGRRIAYTYTSRRCSRGVYIVNADGSGETPIAAIRDEDSYRALSPDGGRIVFQSSRDGNWEIYVMNADGSDVTRLTDHPSFDGDPSWSPDGRRIVFRSNRDDNAEIYVMNADGSDVTRLTDHPSFDGDPGWSPDGRRVAFRSYRDDNPDIYVMNADGSDVTRLTDHPSFDGDPGWSPDGRRVAFRSYRDDNPDIYVMNADGSDVTRLTDHPSFDGDPSWSPDGQSIAFRSYRYGTADIYVMNADGSNVTRLTDHTESEFTPSWSPDGRRIVFESCRGRDDDIYVMNADGTSRTLLVDSPAEDRAPSWSRPDAD